MHDNVVKEQRGGILATLREVAIRSGVSIKTVSRIVNGDAAVTAETRARVQRELEILNYIPNHAARQMRMGTSSVFGLMTDVVTTTPYSVDIVRGAQSLLSDAHETILIASSDGDPQREAELWRMFRAHRVAGVIYASMFHRPHHVGNPAFTGPIILANCFDREGERPSIVPDDEGGGYTQAKYLLERGHRRIAMVTLIPEIEATHLRALGMRRAFAEAGVPYDTGMEKRGMRGPVRQEEMIAYDVARDLLGHVNRPSAIICGNDQIAMQVLAAASSLGLSVPQDLSIMGFDDLKLVSENTHPRLTTVALPYFEIGRKAVELTNLAKAAGASTPEKVLVPCPLIERESCRALV
jgi:LacI family transcriptional regulator